MISMRNVLLFTLILAVMGFSPDSMVKTKVADGIFVSLPGELIPMTPEDIAQRYPSVRAPLGAFTNQDRVVDFSVNTSATSWPDANVEMAKGFFKASLQNMYDRIDFISEGIQPLHKKKFIYFEFESRINGDSKRQGYQDPIMKYTYIQYLVTREKTLVFTFSCPRDLRQDWQSVAKEIMKSIKVKG